MKSIKAKIIIKNLPDLTFTNAPFNCNFQYSFWDIISHITAQANQIIEACSYITAPA